MVVTHISQIQLEEQNMLRAKDYYLSEQVFQVARRFVRISDGKVEAETRYGVTSLKAEEANATRLLQIVRDTDTVGLPRGAAIALCLADTDLTEAENICRALLSHLSALDLSGGAAQARLSVGLAPVARDQSILAATLAANASPARHSAKPANCTPRCRRLRFDFSMF